MENRETIAAEIGQFESDGLEFRKNALEKCLLRGRHFEDLREKHALRLGGRFFYALQVVIKEDANMGSVLINHE